MMAGEYGTSDYLFADPDGSSTHLAAMSWLQGATVNTLAQTIAIVTIAAVGFRMLNGRLEVRRAVQVVLGCFLLFGSASIANGLRESIVGQNLDIAPVVAPIPPPPLGSLPQSTPIPVPYDPYAGASVPQR